MSLNDRQWTELSDYIKNKILHSFDPSKSFTEPDFLSSMKVSHCGFFINVDYGDSNLQSGTLKDNLVNLKETVDLSIKHFIDEAKANNLIVSEIQSKMFYFTLVSSIHYIPDPLSWDENSDGIYFMWGQDFRAMYLPFEIKKLSMTKISVLDRLCSFKAKVPSNLWRLPCGLVWRLACISFSS